jgi:hypothetical protein
VSEKGCAEWANSPIVFKGNTEYKILSDNVNIFGRALRASLFNMRRLICRPGGAAAPMNWPNTRTIHQSPKENYPGWTPYQRKKDPFMADFTAQMITILKGLALRATVCS